MTGMLLYHKTQLYCKTSDFQPYPKGFQVHYHLCSGLQTPFPSESVPLAQITDDSFQPLETVPGVNYVTNMLWTKKFGNEDPVPYPACHSQLILSPPFRTVLFPLRVMTETE